MSDKAKIGIVLLVVVLMALPLAGKLMRGNKGTALQQEYDRIRAEGQPLTFEQLDAWYERLADNAADLYVKAFDAHVEPSPGLESKLPWEKGGATLPPGGQALPEATRLAIQEYVRQNSRSIALLNEAVAHPHCRYPIDFREGPATEIKHLAKIRRAAHLLADQAVLLADTGSPDGSVESLVGVFTLANSLENEPLLISHLVRFACAQIGIDALTWVVHRTPLKSAQSSKLSGALDSFSNEGAFWRAFVGERCVSIGTWDTHMGPGLDATIGAFPPEFRQSVDMDALRKHVQSALFDDDLVYMLHILDIGIEGAKLPPEESQSKLQEATKLVEEAPSNYLITNYGGSGSIVRCMEARERIVAASRNALRPSP